MRKINNFTKTLSLRAKVPNTYGTRLYSIGAPDIPKKLSRRSNVKTMVFWTTPILPWENR